MKKGPKLIAGSALLVLLAAFIWARSDPTNIWRDIIFGKVKKWGEDAPGLSKIRTLRHESYVTAVGWSPDGSTLATYSNFGTLATLWRVDGTRIRELDIFSGRGPYLDNSILFLAGGRELLTPYAHDSAAPSTEAEKNLAFTLWNVETGTVVRNIELPDPMGRPSWTNPLSLALSRDGQTLAYVPIAIDEQVTLYSTNDWRKTGSIPIGGAGPDSDAATSASFSPDGKQLAIGLISGRIKLVDLWASNTTQNLITVYMPTPGIGITNMLTSNIGVSRVAFSPDGQFLASGALFQSDLEPARAPIKVLRLNDRQFIAAYPGHLAPVRQLSWSLDSRYLAAAAGDRAIRVFMPNNPSFPGAVAEFDSPLLSTAFSPDGRLLAVASGNDVTIFALNP